MITDILDQMSAKQFLVKVVFLTVLIAIYVRNSVSVYIHLIVIFSFICGCIAGYYLGARNLLTVVLIGLAITTLVSLISSYIPENTGPLILLVAAVSSAVSSSFFPGYLIGAPDIG